MNKAIFLDRDGTINVEKDYLFKISDFEFLIDVIPALHFLQENGFLLIIITNQSGIARGYYTLQDFHTINNWMIDELASHGVKIEKVYFCPHHPEAKVKEFMAVCNCRKPKLGLYEQAVTDFDLDIGSCYAIGDKIRDCSICQFTDCQGYLIGTNEKKDVIERVKAGEVRNVQYAVDLKDAAGKILLTPK